MRKGMTIGEFATVTHLSVRTLRRYHEAGLLEPETVDPFTGYRYYSTNQVPPAQVIHRLRELDVPLAEVKAILATDDPARRTDLIAGHLRRLEETLDRTRGPSPPCADCCAPTTTTYRSSCVPSPASPSPPYERTSSWRGPAPGTTVRWRSWTGRTRWATAPDHPAASTPTSCSPTAPAP
jgi:DNA-binding transcriptional MerR regulator